MKVLEDKNLDSSFNIIITADHGFATHVGTQGLRPFLIAQGLMNDTASEDIVLAENSVYVKDRDSVMVKKIVSVFQQQAWVGAIFTKASPGEKTKGWVEGTLSLESVHLDHKTRAADIVVDCNWDNRKDPFGYEGTSYSGGVAGHGNSSPYEIHIPMIASGPSFKKGYVSSIPSSNVDIVPTILHLYSLPIPSQMDGRVMSELLSDRSEKQNELVGKEILETTVKHSWGTYKLILERSVVGAYHYVNYTRVIRSYSNGPR